MCLVPDADSLPTPILVPYDDSDGDDPNDTIQQQAFKSSSTIEILTYATNPCNMGTQPALLLLYLTALRLSPAL